MGVDWEWIATTIKRMRAQFGLKKVGVLGHSHGAYASLFAAGGYSKQLENDIYVIFERFSQTFAEFMKWYKDNEKLYTQPQASPIFQNYQRILDEEYKAIIKAMLDSIRRTRFNEGASEFPGKIDAIIALSPPRSTQYAFKTSGLRGLLDLAKSKMVPYQAVRAAMGFSNYMVTKQDRNTDPAAAGISKYLKKMNTDLKMEVTEPDWKGTAHIMSLAIYDKSALVDYLIKMKNPYDYFNILNFFNDEAKKSSDQKYQFISHFVKKIQEIPKLFIYGGKDGFLKGLSQEEIEGVYTICANAEEKTGNLTIERHPELAHHLMQGRRAGNDLNTMIMSSPAVMGQVTNFFKHHL